MSQEKTEPLSQIDTQRLVCPSGDGVRDTCVTLLKTLVPEFSLSPPVPPRRFGSGSSFGVSPSFSGRRSPSRFRLPPRALLKFGSGGVSA